MRRLLMQLHKKIILIFSFGLCIGAGTIYWFRHQTNNNNVVTPTMPIPTEQQSEPVAPKPKPEPAQHTHPLIQSLQQEDQRLWKELERCGVDKAACISYKTKYRNEYKQIRKEFEDKALKKPISKKTLQTIYRIFDEFNIDKNAIAIIPFNNPGCPAGATDHQLLIDERQLLQFPEEAQDYTIAHEVQHIVHQDDSTSFALENLLNLTEEDFDNPNHIFNKRSRFEEKRADALASLKKAKYARGNILFMKKLLSKKKKESAGITHPKEKTRIALAETILKKYHAPNSTLA